MLDTGYGSLEPAPDAAFHGLARGARPPLFFPASAPGVDVELVGLVHEEAPLRREIGLLADRFLSIRGYDRLGFVRASDYAVERLGISGRELRSLAFVASRLEERTLVRRAFLRGGISWSQARLLASVVEAEMEGHWLARAEKLTVEELALETKLARSPSGAVAAELESATDDALGTIDGEETARFSVRCPARVLSLWRRALELARRMIGAEAADWQAAEAIAAEACSVAPPADVGATREDRGNAEPLETVGEKCPSSSAVAAPIALTALRFASERDEGPRSIDQLGCDLTDPFALDHALRAGVARLRRIDARVGRALARAAWLRLHRVLGFRSFDAYVRERLGISPAKAHALIAIERRAAAPEVRRAFATGELSWSRALAILPVVGQGRGRAWVDRAGEVTVRGLRDHVAWALEQRDVLGRAPLPPDHDPVLEESDPDELQIGAAGSGALADRRVTFRGPASVVDLVRTAVSAWMRDGEPGWKGLEAMLLHVVSEWDSQPRHRDPVFARGGWRCAVPGCSSRRNLHDHHLEFRSRGGGNERSNRIPVCAAHHLHGLHRGVIRASGRAPDDVVWELGVRPGSSPLLVLRGERYCGTAPQAL